MGTDCRDGERKGEEEMMKRNLGGGRGYRGGPVSGFGNPGSLSLSAGGDSTSVPSPSPSQNNNLTGLPNISQYSPTPTNPYGISPSAAPGLSQIPGISDPVRMNGGGSQLTIPSPSTPSPNGLQKLSGLNGNGVSMSVNRV